MTSIARHKRNNRCQISPGGIATGRESGSVNTKARGILCDPLSCAQAVFRSRRKRVFGRLSVLYADNDSTGLYSESCASIIEVFDRIADDEATSAGLS
jgi:hypothetical protein